MVPPPLVTLIDEIVSGNGPSTSVTPASSVEALMV
jgi:hypothetical protein